MKRYGAPDFLATTKLLGAAFSRTEEKLLVTSDESGVFNAYELSISDRTLKQRTFSTKTNIFSLSYLPDGESILFLREQEADERVHLYFSDPDGNEKDLTPSENVNTRFYGWSRDKDSFYYTTHESGQAYVDLYRVSAYTFERTRLCRIPIEFVLGGISADEQLLALTKINNSRHSDLFLSSVASNELRRITAQRREALFSNASFDPSGRYLYYVTDLDSEFTYVERCELASGKCELVLAAPGDISFLHFSCNARYRVIGINEDAGTTLHINEEATGSVIHLPDLPKGEITGVTFSDSGRLLAFYVDSDCAPNDLHVSDLANRRVTKLTNTLSPKIAPSDLVESKAVRYRSFDGLEMPSLLWTPQQASDNKRVPGLIWVHGGPGDQITKRYNGLIQYLVNHDYAVLAVNYRGSRGYGKSFRAADDRKHGREPLWDCIEARKYLASLCYVDPSRIGIIGESYGGYMVLAALAFHPDAFEVGVDMFGVSNWLKLLEQLPEHSKSMADSLYAKIGDPRTDAEMLKNISPLFEAQRIVKPLIILQGAKDQGVPREQSDEMVAAIERNRGIVEYLVFGDEGHGFKQRHNQIKAYESILRFLDCYLKQAGREMTSLVSCRL